MRRISLRLPLAAGVLVVQVIALAALVGVAPAAVAQASPSYTWIELPPIDRPPGYQQGSTEGHSLNAGRQVLGSSSDFGFPGPAPVLWTDAVAQQVSDEFGTYLRDINDQGDIVGATGPGDRSFVHATLFRDGQPIDLGTGSEDPEISSSANGINNAGQVVGRRGSAPRASPQLPSEAVLWDQGEVVALGRLAGYPASEAIDINEVGQIIGIASGPDRGERALLWENGQLRDLGTLGGPDRGYTFVEAINDRGQVVGTSFNRRLQIRGFLWENGRMRDLGSLGGQVLPGNGSASDAIDVNNAGTVVGASQFRRGRLWQHAFVWHDGRMTDLNEVVDGLPAGVVLEAATAINEDGVILANSCGIPRDSLICEPGATAWARAYLLIPNS